MASLDALRTRLEAFLRELNREEYEALAGLKPAADLQSIYARHARAIDEEALAGALPDIASRAIASASSLVASAWRA